MVPQIWFLTRKAECRIFQHINVPEILKKIFAGLDVTYDLRGTYHPRDYCVQYRETDFDFAGRLMEEEGVFYFFTHSPAGHRMVVADTPASFPEQPVQAGVEFELSEVGERQADRITEWEKVQELSPGKVTLWDHCFELPHKHLEAETLIQGSVAVGSVTHKLKIGRSDRLEFYEFPGGYAKRFDGVTPGGGDRADDLEHIFEDNRRAVDTRMQEEAAASLTIRGSGHCRRLASGHRFSLARHFNADGDYVTLSVRHSTRLSDDYRSGADEGLTYDNRFTCMPAALPFRPRRATPRPVVRGTQTAVVVGPAGEEIFTDKYGRVKVQFHWDRLGKNDADSSCWIRVGSTWAGKNWGAVHIPRVGHEVIVAFEEGDPDRPIIVGSVYNADQMPPHALPAGKVSSGVKSNSTPGGGGSNEMTLDDTKGKEKITIHGQYDMNSTVEHDQTSTIHNNRTDKVDVDDSEAVGNNQTLSVGNDQKISVGANQTLSVGSDQTMSIGAKQTLAVGADQANSIGAKRTTSVASNDELTVGGTQSISVTGAVSITSDVSITITVGGSSIKIDPSSITLKAATITFEGEAKIESKAAAITSQASGINEITGATIKLN